jgi:histidinol-phosphatase (PHP family)
VGKKQGEKSKFLKITTDIVKPKEIAYNTLMPITADYHIHSSFSGDSDAPMEDVIQQGIALGFDRLCFTEHMDMNFPVSEGTPKDYFLLDTDTYRDHLLAMREKYAGKIKVLFGVELGTSLDLLPELNSYVNKYPFDFVIASSHLANGKDPYQDYFFAGRSDHEALLEYFTAIRDNLLKFNDFEVHGHLDYAVRKSQARGYDYAEYADIFEDILTRLVNNGKGLEINTGSLRYGMAETHPCRAVLRRYRELGGEIITIGSDAHNAKNVAYRFDKAAAALDECGFRYYTVFEGRKAEFVRL